MEQDHNERFQLDRIAMFSDAVFAIAITLLILEMHIPDQRPGTTDLDLLQYLDVSIPKFVGFLVSFFVIGQFWMAHHRMFRYLERSSQALLVSNLFFLLPIVIMPFSTAFFSEYFNGELRVPLAVYTATILLAGLLSFRLWHVALDPANKLGPPVEKVVLRYNSARALMAPAVFVLLFLVSFISKQAAFTLVPFILLSGWAVRRYFLRKHADKIKPHL
ncbi:MAG TPA: TMEM175 family protein [Flavobacteriales bacterium]|nr:TMEM175 family protein [Flavobacteriales bacterium]HRP80543.1 TMEM175 family protein [Flavobacteriales bacterium]HRQ84574.1 TMEM175 family protein [Flavobacteriales bacterium]